VLYPPNDIRSLRESHIQYCSLQIRFIARGITILNADSFKAACTFTSLASAIIIALRFAIILLWRHYTWHNRICLFCSLKKLWAASIKIIQFTNIYVLLRYIKIILKLYDLRYLCNRSKLYYNNHLCKHYTIYNRDIHRINITYTCYSITYIKISIYTL